MPNFTLLNVPYPKSLSMLYDFINYLMIDVKGDGNCLFRCVAVALEGTQNTH
jgi:hypothetical protein